jgi:hypothetical protein
MSEADRAVHERMMAEAHCHRWRAMLIDQQITEAHDMAEAIVAGGVLYSETAPVVDLLFEAAKWNDRDELDHAEGILRTAECEVIALKRRLRRAA